jgi:hypothetical protein
LLLCQGLKVMLHRAAVELVPVSVFGSTALLCGPWLLRLLLVSRSVDVHGSTCSCNINKIQHAG